MVVVNSGMVLRSFGGRVTRFHRVEGEATDRNSERQISIIESQGRQLQVVEQSCFKEFLLDIGEVLESDLVILQLFGIEEMLHIGIL
jgi:hypothetical protein